MNTDGRGSHAKTEGSRDLIADLVELGDEETYKRILAEEFGINPGKPRYQKAMATWAEIRRART